ncbi:hypothetical protein [Haloferula sp.]|uniref:hypothetical protein n=1 Tax=Haloferula sp. TaxID=2497595 RepID=UPI0032A09352
MKVTPDDPRLSAYLLGELSPDEAALIERAVAADPAIRMSLDELGKTTGLLEDIFGAGESERLLLSQREAIRRAGRDADSIGKVVELASAKRSWKPWLGGLGAAAAVAFGAVLMSRVESDSSSKKAAEAGEVTDEIALLPLPGPAAGVGSTGVGSDSAPMEEQARNIENRPGAFLSDVARHLDRKRLPVVDQLPQTGDLATFTSGRATRLPVLLGNSSLRWVSGWVREKQQLPPRNAVRVEELINSASLSGGQDVDGLRVAIESMRCPWRTGSILVAIQVEAKNESIQDLELNYSSAVDHRLLGSFAIREDSQLATTLPARHSTLVMLELREHGGASGALEVKQRGGTRSFETPAPNHEASTGMRHAAALAGFGMWLRNEGVSTAEMRRTLEATSGDQDPVRGDIRRMMKEALKLANSKR